MTNTEITISLSSRNITHVKDLILQLLFSALRQVSHTDANSMVSIFKRLRASGEVYSCTTRFQSANSYQRDNASCYGNPLSAQVINHRHVYTHSHLYLCGVQVHKSAIFMTALPADLRFGYSAYETNFPNCSMRSFVVLHREKCLFFFSRFLVITQQN